MNKALTLLILSASLSSFAAPDDGLPFRIKLGESIFDERFSQARIEQILSSNLDGELTQLEKGLGQEDVLKIQKVFTDVAHDVSISQSFKEEYAEWLTTQLSEDEMKDYLQFLQSALGKRISELDARIQPLFAEAVARRSKGRLETVPLLLADARNK